MQHTHSHTAQVLCIGPSAPAFFADGRVTNGGDPCQTLWIVRHASSFRASQPILMKRRQTCVADIFSHDSDTLLHHSPPTMRERISLWQNSSQPDYHSLHFQQCCSTASSVVRIFTTPCLGHSHQQSSFYSSVWPVGRWPSESFKKWQPEKHSNWSSRK